MFFVLDAEPLEMVGGLSVLKVHDRGSGVGRATLSVYTTAHTPFLHQALQHATQIRQKQPHRHPLL